MFLNKNKNKKSKRKKIIDFIRGIAFILMMIHHIYYFRIFKSLPYQIPLWVEICGIISRNTFIILSGFVSSKYHSKYFTIFINALIITFSSYIFLPKKNMIYMGVLHYLFLSLLTLHLFKSFPKIILLLGYLSYKFRNFYIPVINNPADLFIPYKWFYKSVIGYIIGTILFYIPDCNSNLFYINKLGEHSLLLYTIHIVIFMFFQNRFFF